MTFQVPRDLVSVPIDIPESFSIQSIEAGELPKNWRDYPAPETLQAIGPHWIERGDTVALMVPSALIAVERNVVLNPGHRRFAELAIGRAERFALDPRLVRRPR